MLLSVGVSGRIPHTVHELQGDRLQLHLHLLRLDPVLGHLLPTSRAPCDFEAGRDLLQVLEDRAEVGQRAADPHQRVGQVLP